MRLTLQVMEGWTTAADLGKVSLEALNGMLGALKANDEVWERHPRAAKRLFAALKAAIGKKEGAKAVRRRGGFTPQEREAMRRKARFG